MLKFISEFKNYQERNINIPLIKRESEEDLVTFVVDIYKSLEVTGFITFLGYDVEYDESKIDASKYITTRKKVKKQDKDIRYQYIHPDRCIEVTLRFKIHVKDEEANISKSILIPKIDNDKYYTIRGKRYFLLYQLVDNSTYTSRKGITLKSVMPICINKEMDTLKDVEGTVHDVPYYYIDVFKREIETFLFYFAKIGFTNTMRFFTMDNILSIVTERPDKNDENYYYFAINKNLTIKVLKYFFDKYLYVQSMVLMVKRACNTKTTFQHLEDTYYWTQRIGALYTATPYKLYDSGKSTITFFERLLDITTQQKLKLSNINKLSIYSVVKWIVQNYIELKKKDNLDLDNKRLRLYEYIAAILSKRVNEGINRILTLGSKVKMKQVRDVFKFSGTIILQLLYISPLLKYDDRSNDNDSFSSLRYSVRGPNSLGMRSERNISIKYRACHPSYLGKLDLNTCSSSSPGLNGCISPFAKTDKLWFNKDKEPESQEFELYKDKIQYNEDHPDGKLHVVYTTENSDKYYDAKYNVLKNIEGFKANIPSPDDQKLHVKFRDAIEWQEL